MVVGQFISPDSFPSATEKCCSDRCHGTARQIYELRLKRTAWLFCRLLTARTMLMIRCRSGFGVIFGLAERCPCISEFAVLRNCLKCGFPVAASDRTCPKCDSQIALQTDGSTTTIDIAHSKQRVNEAIAQLRSMIEKHQQGTTQFLRFIVGGDRIRLAAINELRSMQSRGVIVRYGSDDRNRGALIVVLKRPD